MEWKFEKHQQMMEQYTKLLERWNACYTLFYKTVQSEFPSETKGATHKIKEKLNDRDFKGVAQIINELGASLDRTNEHLQDLCSICQQMWDLVKDQA